MFAESNLVSTLYDIEDPNEYENDLSCLKVRKVGLLPLTGSEM
jgi:hypothetical protein